MDMKKILQAFDSASGVTGKSKHVQGAEDMKKFVSIIRESALVDQTVVEKKVDPNSEPEYKVGEYVRYQGPGMEDGFAQIIRATPNRYWLDDGGIINPVEIMQSMSKERCEKWHIMHPGAKKRKPELSLDKDEVKPAALPVQQEPQDKGMLGHLRAMFGKPKQASPSQSKLSANESLTIRDYIKLVESKDNKSE